MTKGNKGFGALLTDRLEEESISDTSAPAKSVMASRSDALGRIATGKVVTDRTEFVDPARCRPWRLHNRDLDHLDEASCRDLIDGFLSAKKQRIPAIVRRLRDDPDCDYEIVAGVRRWWTVRWLQKNNHPEFDYLITVQQLTDEEAFRVSDIENRTRKDISDWERAREYLNAMNEFYGGSLTRMAEHLAISKSWLSRMLDVARLPEEVVIAFSDRHDITVRVARDLKPLLGEARSAKAIAAEAKAIAAEREGGCAALGGSQTAKRLVSATLTPKTSTSPTASTLVKSSAGKPMLRFRRGTEDEILTIKVLPKSGATKKELLRALDQLL